MPGDLLFHDPSFVHGYASVWIISIIIIIITFEERIGIVSRDSNNLRNYPWRTRGTVHSRFLENFSSWTRDEFPSEAESLKIRGERRG